MPSRRSGDKSPRRRILGPQRIGQAFNQRYQELNRERLGRAYRRLLAEDVRIRKPIQNAAKDNIISHEEKRAAIVGNERIRLTMAAHCILAMVLSEDLNDEWERGRRLRDSVEQCLTVLASNESPVLDPYAAIIARLARKYLDQVLSELKRLGILDVCSYCTRTFFPASPRKRKCSLDYEGRDCASRQASSNYYRKTKTQKG
jgi:hypothetical protein